VSWNVAGRAPLHCLERLEPDLCLLQEIGDIASASARSRRLHEFQCVAGFDPGTLSRYPLTPLPSGPVGSWQPPQLLLLTLPSGHRIVVCNVRLMLPSAVVALAGWDTGFDLEAAYAVRHEQYRRLAALLGKAMRSAGTGSAILAGDFNVPARMPSLDPLRALLADVWPSRGVGWGGTMTAEMPLARIDQCWVSRDIEVVSARVLDVGGSDHRLLVVDLLVG
jgi:endonuclease/exonuclease/phosphatase (EEP) superfamily protein YafD